MTNNTAWSIYIDIEGFGSLYDKEYEILIALGDLMEAIYLIGVNYYTESPNRIFAYQTGDGFVIVGEFPVDTLEIPISIAITLLRHVAKKGRFAKASIAEGEITDIVGCYPKRILDALGDNKFMLSMGGGLMTIFPIMGTALIKSFKIGERSPSGALLVLDESQVNRIPKECLVQTIIGRGLVSVDWVHSDLSLIEKIQIKSGLEAPSASNLTNIFSKYFSTMDKVKNEWKANSNWFLSLNLSANIL